MALKNGAMSGKILGAGGGGFIMFITKNSQEKNKLIKFLDKLVYVDFNFETEGTKIITRGINAFK
jgi:D-glycero-alpha-D-manno-heptose-7-phosphate kinase